MWYSFILEGKIKMLLYFMDNTGGENYQDIFRFTFPFSPWYNWILMMITVSSFKCPILLICPSEVYLRRVFFRFADGEIWCCFLFADKFLRSSVFFAVLFLKKEKMFFCRRFTWQEPRALRLAFLWPDSPAAINWLIL